MNGLIKNPEDACSGRYTLLTCKWHEEVEMARGQQPLSITIIFFLTLLTNGGYHLVLHAQIVVDQGLLVN